MRFVLTANTDHDGQPWRGKLIVEATKCQSTSRHSLPRGGLSFAGQPTTLSFTHMLRRNAICSSPDSGAGISEAIAVSSLDERHLYGRGIYRCAQLMLRHDHRSFQSEGVGGAGYITD